MDISALLNTDDEGCMVLELWLGNKKVSVYDDQILCITQDKMTIQEVPMLQEALKWLKE